MISIRPGEHRLHANKLSDHPPRSRPYRCLLAVLAGAAGLLFIGIRIAAAADVNGPTEALSEIVVTATRQAENAQHVAMSITPITAATIQQAGITDFQDYAHMVPNLSFSHSFGVGGSDVTIRGIQGTGTVAFYIDDVPIAQELDPRLLDDVDRIEVLHGPQGTLYGARSMGGTVRIITSLPDSNTWSGAVNVQGTDYNGGRPGYQTDGFLNVPLIADKLALRVSAFDGSDGPFIRREWLKSPTPATLASLQNSQLTPAELSQYPLAGTLTGRNNYRGVMASLLWTPTDNLSVRGTFMRQDDNYNGWPLSDFEITPTTSDYTAGSLSQIRTFDIPEWGLRTWWLAGLTVKYEMSLGELTSSTGYVHELNSNYEDTTEFFHSFFVANILPVPPFPAPIFTWSYTHSLTQEIRFASKPLGPFEFISGLYINRTSEDDGQNYTVPGANAATGGFLGTDVAFYTSGLFQDFENAIYGDLTYHLTEKLAATAGLRESRIYTANFTPEEGFVVGGSNGGGGSIVQTSSMPKIDFQYQQTPNVMYYMLASKGFRPGGGQVAPPIGLCASSYAALGLTPADLSKIGADYLWNYEVGAKTETFNHRLQMDVSAYQMNWKDIKQDSRLPCGFTFQTNAGAARSRGAELSIAAAPLSGLRVSASVGYEDAVITQSSPTLTEQVGQPIQQVAPWNASASAEYTFALTPIWSGVFRTDYNYTDHSFSANNGGALRLRPSYELTNVRAGVTSDHWDIYVFVNNLTDAHPNLGDGASEAVEDPGRPRIYTSAPRTLGLQTGYRF